MAQLSDSERAQVKAAHDKAIQSDPTLEQKMKEARQAMDAARQAMHEAMVKADPSVEPILAKMNPGRDGKRGPGPEPQGSPSPSISATNPPVPALPKPAGPAHHEPQGMASLTEVERQRVKTLHEQVKSDPSVVNARDAVKNATTPEARQASQEVLHRAIHDAMIKIDPSISPVLDKISPPKQQPQ